MNQSDPRRQAPRCRDRVIADPQRVGRIEPDVQSGNPHLRQEPSDLGRGQVRVVLERKLNARRLRGVIGDRQRPGGAFERSVGAADPRTGDNQAHEPTAELGTTAIQNRRSSGASARVPYLTPSG